MFDEEPEEKENECWYCDAPCDGAYCSTACKNADLD